jgi:Fe-Mn family superoxide dismutase
MRGKSAVSVLLASLLSATNVLASEQQPFEFGEMSAPQYTLPKLPYAYDVSPSETVISPLPKI